MVVRKVSYHLYLLLDEYDNFANDLMMTLHQFSQSRETGLLTGETTLKMVLKVVKAARADVAWTASF